MTRVIVDELHTVESPKMLSAHVFWYLLARGFPALVSFGSVVLFARWLGPKAYGTYSLLIVTATTGNIVLFQWIRLSLFRFYPANRDCPGTLVNSVLKCFAGVSAALLLIGPALLYVAGSRFHEAIYFTPIVMCVLLAWIELSLELKRVKLQPKTYGAIMLLRSGLILSFGSLAILWQCSTAILLVSTLAALTVTSIVCVRCWRGETTPRGGLDLVKPLARYGLPLTPAFALGFVLNGFDRFFLGKVAGTVAVGQYAAGADIALQSIGVVLMSVNLASYPLIVRAHESRNGVAVRRGFERNLLFYVLLSTPLLATFLFQANAITHLLFGLRYSESTPTVLSITALSAIILGLKNGHFDIAFSLSKRTELSLVPNAIGAAACVCAHLILTARYGAVGAACSSLIGCSAAMLASFFLGRRFIKIPAWEPRCTRVALAGILMGAVLAAVGKSFGSIEIIGIVALVTVMFYVLSFVVLRKAVIEVPL